MLLSRVHRRILEYLRYGCDTEELQGFGFGGYLAYSHPGSAWGEGWNLQRGGFLEQLRELCGGDARPWGAVCGDDSQPHGAVCGEQCSALGDWFSG